MLALSFVAGWGLGLSPLTTILLYSLGAAGVELGYLGMAWSVARSGAHGLAPSATTSP